MIKKKKKCSVDGCNSQAAPSKRGFCDYHYTKQVSARKARKAKAAKNKYAPEVKVTKKSIETVRKRLSKKLDILFSKLIKRIYPFKCHGKCDGRPLKIEEAQCCHFVSRRKVLVRWFIANALPGCAKCNMSEQDHIYFLGKYINGYYGDGYAESISIAGKRNSVKLEIDQMELMVEEYSKALDYLKTIEHLSDKEQTRLKKELRENIITKTKFFTND